MNEGPYRGASSREPDEPAPDPARPYLLQTWLSSRECPNCGVPLFAARKEGYRIDACGRCSGAWLDNDTSKRAIEERNLTPALLSEQAAEHAQRAPSQPRRCPVCEEPLKALVVPDAGRQVAFGAPPAPVVIDACAEHGSWFDPGEMRLVIEAIVRRNPIVLDPSVDEAIAREAELGRRRPPENYDPGNSYHLQGPGLLDVVNFLLTPPRR